VPKRNTRKSTGTEISTRTDSMSKENQSNNKIKIKRRVRILSRTLKNKPNFRSLHLKKCLIAQVWYFLIQFAHIHLNFANMESL
jgi:hypothetical protein